MKPKTEPKHTPTPWGYTYDGSSDWSIGPVNDPQSNPVMNVWSKDDDKARANAGFIVRAVNSHEALLKMAKYYHQSDDMSFKIHQRVMPNCEDCRTIAQAEGETK